MRITHTHTFAILEVSTPVYEEIKEKLRAAGYGHAFIKSGGKEVIDMHGIALQSDEADESKSS